MGRNLAAPYTVIISILAIITISEVIKNNNYFYLGAIPIFVFRSNYTGCCLLYARTGYPMIGRPRAAQGQTWAPSPSGLELGAIGSRKLANLGHPTMDATGGRRGGMERNRAPSLRSNCMNIGYSY